MTSVEDEWERELESEEDLDLLFVTYEPAKVSVEKIKHTMKAHGFDAEVKK